MGLVGPAAPGACPLRGFGPPVRCAGRTDETDRKTIGGFRLNALKGTFETVSVLKVPFEA